MGVRYYDKPDYEYKSALLACGAVKLYNQWHFAMHYWELHNKIIGEECAYVPCGEHSAFYVDCIQALRSYEYSPNTPKYLLFDYNTANEYFQGFDPLGILACREDFNECRKIARASVCRTLRLKKRVRWLLTNGNGNVFVTLTFCDNYLLNSTPSQRKRAVRHWLGSLGCPYISNIDFGKKNGREHYHAIVNMHKIPVSRILEWNSWHGNCDVEKVRLSYDSDGVITDESSTRLAKYINKLCNHAIKETAKRQVIMYSRSDWPDKVKLRARQVIKASFRDLPVIRHSLVKYNVLSPWERNFQLNLFGLIPQTNFFLRI